MLNRTYISYSLLGTKHHGSDVIVFDAAGSVLTYFGKSRGYNGSTCSYHDIAIDEDENIYIGDILGNRIQKVMPVDAH